MSKVQISIVMGSNSDYKTIKEALPLCEKFQVTYETKVVSAHRTPEKMVAYAKEARDNGVEVIIAAAGGAAHLPGMIASLTTLPVIGVPIQSKALNGLDSLLSIVQMPAGVPVMTVAIGEAGAKNAVLSAIRILSLNDKRLANELASYQQELIAQVEAMELI